MFELELTPMTDAKLEALRTEIKVFRISLGTGKSLSEALIFALTNLQYHDMHENSKLRTWGKHVVNTNCFLSLF